MELKTKVHAVDGKQEILITRDFDLPVDLLFKAHVEPELVEQWMGTKVLMLEGQNHGRYDFETTDPKGNKYRFHGVIHEFVPDERITRTFQFDQMPFGIQLETMTFEKIDDERSRISTQIIFQSVEQRDQQLKMPFAYGLSMAHDRLEEIAGKLK
jgi:uncharacterized protein YndB with AHSA1/START domain